LRHTTVAVLSGSRTAARSPEYSALSAAISAKLDEFGDAALQL
jgi:hypothetical protein